MDDRVFGSENSLYFSDKKEEILVVTKGKGEENASFKVLNYKDILEVEVVEDGDSITKTSRMSQAGRMLIGGVVLGGVGAVVGGLSGSTKTINKVSTIDIKILINDTKNPLLVFNVMTIKEGVEKKSFIYTNNKNNADKIHAILKVIIQEIDTKDESLYQTTTIEPPSIADELMKLNTLKNDNVITEEEEYKTAKLKVLSSH